MIRAVVASLAVAAALAIGAVSLAAAQVPGFDPDALSGCVEGGGDRGCIGLAAEACIGDSTHATTPVLSYCYARERDWWDAGVARTYAALGDAEAGTDRADKLRAMERAWTAFRDEACDYEFSRFDGGTAAGPALAHCQMRRTAEHMLYLRGLLASRP